MQRTPGLDELAVGVISPPEESSVVQAHSGRKERGYEKGGFRSGSLWLDLQRTS
jgi:hypothetical protein